MLEIITVATERQSISLNIDHIASVQQETHLNAVTVNMSGGATHTGTKTQFAPVLSALGIAMAGYRADAVRAAQQEGPRPAFVEAYPHLRAEHGAVQGQMFAAATARGLNTENSTGMIDSICQCLKIEIDSRRQLTITEMQLLIIHLKTGTLTWPANPPRRELRIAA